MSYFMTQSVSEDVFGIAIWTLTPPVTSLNRYPIFYGLPLDAPDVGLAVCRQGGT